LPKGPREPLTVGFPPEHLAHHRMCAKALGIPATDYVAFRAAVFDGLRIPDEALLADPGVVLLMEPDDCAAALACDPRIARRLDSIVLRPLRDGTADPERLEAVKQLPEYLRVRLQSFLAHPPSSQPWIDQEQLDLTA